MLFWGPILAVLCCMLTAMRRFATLFFIVFATPTFGQSVTPFERQLMELAGHFGTMHHLTQICEHDEVQIWRDAMLELMSLETPSRDQRNRMSERFNDAYHEVEQRFPTCTGDARSYAGDLGAAGAELTRQMAQSLR